MDVQMDGWMDVMIDDGWRGGEDERWVMMDGLMDDNGWIDGDDG